MSDFIWFLKVATVMTAVSTGLIYLMLTAI